MRILVVEDDRKVARFVRQGLCTGGQAVEIAQGASEALDFAFTEPAYDLIVLDVMLRGQDEFGVLKTLRAHNIAVPVLMLTARDSVADEVAGLDLGADDYLTKPFAFDRALAGYMETPAVMVPLGLGLALVGGAWLARSAPRPMETMSRTARRITAQDLTQRLPLRGAADELDHLAETRNAMFARLEAASTHVRRFAVDAAHELRTPLTVLEGSGSRSRFAPTGTQPNTATCLRSSRGGRAQNRRDRGARGRTVDAGDDHGNRGLDSTGTLGRRIQRLLRRPCHAMAEAALTRARLCLKQQVDGRSADGHDEAPECLRRRRLSRALADQALMTRQTVSLPGSLSIAQSVERRGGIWLVSLRRPKGGHAVAIHSEPTRSVYRHSDSNLGHFRLNPASRFKAWLNQFLMKSGYAARYTSGSVLRLV